MPTTGHDSSTQYGLEPIPVDGSRVTEGAIWLDGGVLACACPECGAPMSIRLWLMVADCFRCGTSIELTERQEEEALRLLRRQEASKRAQSREAATAISPTVLRRPKPRPVPKPRAEHRHRPHRVAASEVYRGPRAHIRNIYRKGGIAVFWTQFLRDLPAWLVSLVVHLVAMILLGLWIDRPPDQSRFITLSTSESYQDVEGEQGEIEEVPKAFEFDDPGAIEFNSVVEQAGAPTEPEPELEPVEVPLDVTDPVGIMPELAARPISNIPMAPVGRMFAGRDPQLRAQAVRRSGGTSYTEAAVSRGLKFLARHQNTDGSWSLHAFNKTPDCDETCTGAGYSHSDTAATALALLPFLGAGQTHQQGQYVDQVTGGLRWLVEHQKEDGDLCGPGHGRMYAHGQAGIALCEAYALTGDEQLREPAQLALNFIVRAQHPQGGWRYNPGQAGDTSVVGWQLMALKSGQMAHLHVPTKTFELAGLFLDQVRGDEIGGLYCYQRGRPPTPAMTAEALLCRQYLGWPKDHPGLQAGVKYLLERHPPDAKRPNIYYWYYATQVMHHFGGKRWEKWNAKMRQALCKMQQKKGHAAGSWAPQGAGHNGGFADRGGRIYMTSLAVCILEVYYRHMPLYGKEVLGGFE